MTFATRALLAGMLLGGLFIFGLTFTPLGWEMGIGNSKRCIRTLTGEQLPGTKAIVVGSSRTRRSVDPDALASSLGYPRNSISNIAHPRASLPFDYTAVERSSKKHDLDFVVVEIFPTSKVLRQKERAIDPGLVPDIALVSGNYDEFFLLAVPYGSQFELIDSLHASAAEGVWDTMSLFISRLGRQTTLVARVKWIKHVISPDRMDPARKNICFMEEWDAPTTEAQLGSPEARALRQAYRDEFDHDEVVEGDDTLGWFTDHSSRLERQLVDRFVQLGRENGFRPIFYYLPSVEIPVDRERIVERFQDRFDAPLLTPDLVVRKELEDGGFYDNNHLNTKGRAILTRWLAESIELERANQP